MGELALTGGRMRSQLRDHQRDPTSCSGEIHNRMPVILKPATWPARLGKEPTDAAQLKGMLGPYRQTR